MAITISGQNNNDKILASDGVLDQISGFNVVGVMTAGTFDVTGETSTGHLSVGSNIHIGNAGIITATTLVGNVTGNINHTSNLLLQISGSEKFRVGNGGQFGIAGANYGTAGQVFTSGGSGSAPTWSTIPTQVTINNASGNRIITSDGGTTLNGESNLTYDGTNLQLITDANNEGIKLNSTSTGSSYPVFEMNANRSAGNTLGKLVQKWNGTEVASIQFVSGSDGTNKDDAHIYFNTADAGTATERVRIDSSGRLLVGAGAAANPKSSGAGSIDLDNQAFTIIVGGNHPSGGRSDNNAKTFRMSMVHNTLAEEPINILQGYCDSSDNNLYIGGGTGAANSLTQVRVYTGTNTTTTGGTERIRINNAGAIGLSGANYGSSGQVLTSQGSGSAVAWSTVSGTTINNNADNRVITGSGTANTLNGESNFTVDSNGAVTIAPSSAGVTQTLRSNGTTYGGTISLINTQSSDYRWDIAVGGGDNAYVSGRGLLLRSVTDSKNVAAFQTDGDVLIHDGNLKVASGHGIDFSADGSGTLKTLPNSFNAELLHDYENGTFTPNIQYDTGTNRYAGSNVSSAVGEYIRIGDLVSFGMKITLTGNRNYSENIHLYIGGLPYNGMHSSFQSSMMNGWGGWACPTNDSNSSYKVHYCFHGYTTVNLRFSQSSGTGGISGFYVWGFYRTAP